jgi:hypothetical protein
VAQSPGVVGVLAAVDVAEALLRTALGFAGLDIAVAPPALERYEPGLLQDVLGEVEVPQRACEGGDRPAPHLSVEAGGRNLEVGGCRAVRTRRGPHAP